MFLLVDLLNNLKELPENTSNVSRNLKMRLGDFDAAKVENNLALYGKARAREVLQMAHA
jgi:FPC/CPF motif-containing protein YcgG